MGPTAGPANGPGRASQAAPGRPVVVVLTRFPRVGAVKTRLVPYLGATGATDLYRDLASHCVSGLRPLHATREASVEVHFEGGSERAVRDWIGRWPRLVPQKAGDLGDRLRAALSGAISAGAREALAVGSDCPAARATHVRAALRSLETHDVVIGPAEDGGYWLLGVTAQAAGRALPALFEDIGWGGPDVFAQTMERIRAAGLHVAVADRLADVDRPEDLDEWSRERALRRAAPASVSVVVPALDESARVGAAVDSALRGGASEVIVVDGGSTDGTPLLAAAAGARVIETAPGRARQMNEGAAAATGDALVFLHADTRLPADFAEKVCEALTGEDVSGGSFTWGTDDTRLSALFNWVGRARVAVFGVPYGDQALFLRRRTFEDLGGYPVQPIMEDWELARRLRRLGSLRIVPERAMTSSRRWTEAGVIRASAAYLAIIAGYRLGIDPVALDGWRRP
jgi:rSAM/selenodomain-associated transferase 2/rSAM/selenodomain-associated transferase 1